jgi:hypothetical protein
MPLPEPLRLPTPRQPTPEIRAGRAYRSFGFAFVVLLTVAIVLFVISVAPGVPPRWHWPLWIASSVVISLTAPLRAWGLRKGVLSYYVHGTAAEGRVLSVDPAGDGSWRVRFRFPAPGGAETEADAVLHDSPAAPLRPSDPVAVLHRADDPADAVLAEWCGILPDRPATAA